MMEGRFKLMTKMKPSGSQPDAIDKLVKGVNAGMNFQTLLGVTGSGKTFTMANVIEKINKPTLILAHNKTLAAQLYAEFKELFPENRVEYFVSFYDYYQPESYIPSKDQFIEKDSAINAVIEQMRLSSTTSLMTRNDTIIVASVSCIYGLGNPKNYLGMGFDLKKNENMTRRELLGNLIDIQYERNDTELISGRFRVKGDTIDIIPGHMKDIIRVELFGDEIDKITQIDKNTGKNLGEMDHYFIFPTRHFVTPKSEKERVVEAIKNELEATLPDMEMIEAHRLKQRTLYDIEMIEEVGYCKGIENYSRHFDGRHAGDKPYCLLDYFPKDFLFIVDESHQSIPQLHGMYKGDRARKTNLVDYGFRLPCALDNRPLKFEEVEKYFKKTNTIFVSATPAVYEKKNSEQIVEQIIRPTGLIDPEVVTRPAKNQMDDLLKEISRVIKNKDRILITALTKKLAEELSDYLSSKGIKTRYLHSEIKTLERTEILRQLRLGTFDVLVGINLLREGIDLPEVGLVAILDADKEGFLRNASSLIQIMGRAARNEHAKVIMYADNNTDSMKIALRETNRRRKIQVAYNEKNNITPKSVSRPIPEGKIILRDTKHIPKAEKLRLLKELDKEMKDAAKNLDFELAIEIRDQVTNIEKGMEEKEKEKSR